MPLADKGGGGSAQAEQGSAGVQCGESRAEAMGVGI